MNQDFKDPTLRRNVPHLLEYLSRAIDREVSALIEPPRLAKSGAENRNYYVSAKVEGTAREFVLRCPPENIPNWRREWGLYDLEREFRVLQEVPALNIALPTPKVYGFGDRLGVLSFLMDRLPGAPLDHKYDASYRNVLPAYANSVAALSNMAVESGSWLRANLPMRTIANGIAWNEEQSQRFRNEPMRNYALSWLREHRPQSRPLVMSHGDPNPSNFLMAGEQITGVVDWEFACLTDDSLGGLLRITWLYERQELRQLFCQAMQRDISELTWHVVHWLFHFMYVSCIQDRLQHEARLAELVGYKNGS
jgi:aminoglycoside phosphotransferase (APT) family kinase protein